MIEISRDGADVHFAFFERFEIGEKTDDAFRFNDSFLVFVALYEICDKESGDIRFDVRFEAGDGAAFDLAVSAVFKDVKAFIFGRDVFFWGADPAGRRLVPPDAEDGVAKGD